MKPYDIAVIIGRFQPLHNGHLPAFRKAAEIADLTVCVIGSAEAPPSPKNPFTVYERTNMIRHEFPDVEIVSVKDSFYCERAWINSVKQQVFQYTSEIADNKYAESLEELEKVDCDLATAGVPADKYDLYMELHGKDSEVGRLITRYREIHNPKIKIAVLGHDKDPSSYYLHNFAGWDFIDTATWVKNDEETIINATDIRDLWFSNKFHYALSVLPKSVYNFMCLYSKNKFMDLREEYEYLKKYRKETQVGPFPVQFLTTDAVVLHGDEVLMIRRGVAPGKGLWALPGGFKGEKETFFEACFRELNEETGIAVPEKVLRASVKEEKIFDYPERSSRGTTVSMAYLFVLDAKHPRPRVHGADDAVQAWWFPISELKQMKSQIFEDHLDIIEYMVARV